MTTIKGKSETICIPAPQLFGAFADMRHFVQNLPEDKKESIQATEDTLVASVQGFEIGAQICSRMPYSYVQIKEFGNTPFKFTLEVFLNPVEIQKTEFHLELNADLPFMLKMMLGSKLQTMVDTITEKIKEASEGKFNPGDIDIDQIRSKMNL